MTQPPHDGQHGATTELDPLVDEFVRFFETWGVRGTVARVWATIYLAPTPLGQDELRALTGLSAGMISMALQELERWEAVRVHKVAGSRRLHYDAEPELLGILRRILRQRDLAAVRRLRAAVAHARKAYQPPAARDRLEARYRAVEQAAELYEAFFAVIEGVSRLPGLLPTALGGLRRLAGRPAPDKT